MFKHYPIRLKTETHGLKWVLDFYVHSKATRTGFMHQAIVIGCLPKENPGTYTQEEHKVRYHRVSYSNRTWEEWSGQTCLRELWDNIMKCKLFKKDRFPKKNPFCTGVNEPKHDVLEDPEELFRRD